MKKVLSLVLAVLMVLAISACGEKNENVSSETVSEDKIAVPDIENTDEATAKNILSSNGLIPKIENEYDEIIEAGNVIKTDPPVGSKVDKNSKVTVYISKGKSRIDFKSGNITWYNISTEDDWWEADSPYIENNVLYMPCKNVRFSVPMKWHDKNNTGEIHGDACINDTFDKCVPVRAKYEKQSWEANEEQNFTLEIPLSDLSVEKPTDMYLRLFAYKENNDNQIKIRVDFTLTW